jgi:type II secretory pathway component PulF
MVFALMRARANSKRKCQTAFAAVGAFILLASAGATLAQGMDATDRQDKMDVNRERAQTRIERLHEGQQGPRAQEKTNFKKTRKTPKKPQQRLQY